MQQAMKGARQDMRALSVLTTPFNQQSAPKAKEVPGSRQNDATAKCALDAAADGAGQAILLRGVHLHSCAVLALLSAPLLCQQLLRTDEEGFPSGYWV